MDKLAGFGEPVIQEYLQGDGVGISILMSEESRPLSFVCHSRIRELPVYGGPLSCCVSIYNNKALLALGVKIFEALKFKGPAMVEFKVEHLWKINPRVLNGMVMRIWDLI